MYGQFSMSDVHSDDHDDQVNDPMEGFNIPRDEEPGLSPEDLNAEKSVRLGRVGDRLFAANLLGAASSDTDHAVISLCRTADLFANHRYHRQVFLLDRPDPAENPDLAKVVLETVNALDQALDAGLNVVVHCHGGRSRTALILKAWKMRKDGMSEIEAHDWLERSWPIIHRNNSNFHNFLVNEWSQMISGDSREGF